MRVVLDTNVFVSGVFFSGPPHRILQAWRRGRLQLVVSPEILAEYNRVGEELAERFHGIDLRPILDFVAVTADMIHRLPRRHLSAAIRMTTSFFFIPG